MHASKESKESKASGNRWMAMAILSIVALVAAACGAAEPADDPTDPDDSGPRPIIVATTTIWGDVARNVVGDDADVEVLMPVGGDPHDFQASSSQVAAVYSADLVIANGLGLEEGLADVLEGAAGDGVNVLEVAPLLDPIVFGSDGHSNDDEGDHDGDEYDPHVWMDPLRVAEGARLIADALAAIAPDVDWMARADAYAADLTEADDSIVATLSGVEEDDRVMVTNHDALGYFADRYGFEVVGVVIPGGSTLGDPSSREIADLVETMRSEGVTAIFVETTQPSVLAEAVSAELGGNVDVVELYTGSVGEPGTGADTVIGMLTTNAERIAEALS